MIAEDPPNNAPKVPLESSIGAVFESDLGLALWIQLRADPVFLDRLVRHVIGRRREKWRTVSLSKNRFAPGFCETDLRIIVEHASGHRIALLIENKIDAAFQPRQAERYIELGERGRRTGEWEEYRTVLIAPAHYITDSVACYWQNTLSVENACGWLDDVASNPYAAAVAKILWGAASRRKRDEQEDPAATSFWQSYVDHATRHFPRLQVELTRSSLTRPGVLKKALFGCVILRDSVIEVAHNSKSAWVDLRVPRCSSGRLDAAMHASLRNGMFCAPAGRWAAVRVNVPRIDPLQPFESQIYPVRAIFEAGQHFIHFYGLHREALEELAS